MGKFDYSENDLVFADTQCGLCSYLKEGCDGSCQKYDKIPEKIIMGQTVCPYLHLKDILEL